MIAQRLAKIGLNLSTLSGYLYQTGLIKAVIKDREIKNCLKRIANEMRDILQEFENTPEYDGKNRHRTTFKSYGHLLYSILRDHSRRNANDNTYLIIYDAKFGNDLQHAINSMEVPEPDIEIDGEFESNDISEETRLHTIWSRLVNYFSNHFNKPTTYDSDPWYAKAWFWVVKIIQLPIVIVEDSLRTILKGFFYTLRHPLSFWKNDTLDDIDEDQNLNPLQYAIKDIGIAFDEMLAGTANMLKHPIDTLIGIATVAATTLKAIKEAFQKLIALFRRESLEAGETENLDKVAKYFKDTWKHFKKHPIQYITKLLVLAATIYVLWPKAATNAPKGFMVITEETATLSSFAKTMPLLTATPTATDNSFKSENNLTTELIEALKLLKKSYNISKNEKCNEEYLSTIRNEIIKIEQQLRAINPEIESQHSYAKELKAAIKLLKNNLMLYSGEENLQTPTEINTEIATLQKELNWFEKAKANSNGSIEEQVIIEEIYTSPISQISLSTSSKNDAKHSTAHPMPSLNI